MTSESADPGHGNSPAAWTAVTIMLVAFVVGTFAFWLVIEWLVWAAAVLLVIGFLVGVIMSKLGYGAYGDKGASKEHA